MNCGCLNNFFICVCHHDKGCQFRVSITCAVPIECEHGYDVCPQCDACNCRYIMNLNKKLKNGKTTKQLKVLDKIEELETKYRMNSDVMLKKLKDGNLKETFEICQWLIYLKIRNEHLMKTHRKR